MTDTEMILQAINGINNRLDGMDSRFDGIDSRLDRMEKDIDDVKKDINGINNRLDVMEADIKAINITIENDVRKDIKLLAEGHELITERLADYKNEVDDRLGTNDLIDFIATYVKTHK